MQFAEGRGHFPNPMMRSLIIYLHIIWDLGKGERRAHMEHWTHGRFRMQITICSNYILYHHLAPHILLPQSLSWYRISHSGLSKVGRNEGEVWYLKDLRRHFRAHVHRSRVEAGPMQMLPLTSSVAVDQGLTLSEPQCLPVTASEVAMVMDSHDAAWYAEVVPNKEAFLFIASRRQKHIKGLWWENNSLASNGWLCCCREAWSVLLIVLWLGLHTQGQIFCRSD